MRIPFLDLKRQYESIKDEIDESIQRVVESQSFILGEEVERFENEIAEYCGAKHAIGVGSGTDALLLSLQASGIGEGDKVITTPFTFFATAGAIVNAGAEPVFADIDLETFNINPSEIMRLLNQDSQLRNQAKAIIPVHLFGQMADMDRIMEIAQENGLIVIEDAAQAIGAEYKGEKAGTIGDLGCFSFFPSKNLGGYGDGGMVITDDTQLADKVRKLRAHGSSTKYYHQMVGYNSRLDALQAAILSAKLPYLDKWSEQRMINAQYYNEQLQGLKHIITPGVPNDQSHIYHQYTIRVKNRQRDKLQQFLNQKNIGTKVYYPLPLHLQECFKEMNWAEGNYPISEYTAKEVLSLPVYPELTKAELNYVIKSIQSFIKDESS